MHRFRINLAFTTTCLVLAGITASALAGPPIKNVVLVHGRPGQTGGCVQGRVAWPSYRALRHFGRRSLEKSRIGRTGKLGAILDQNSGCLRFAPVSLVGTPREAGQADSPVLHRNG